MVPTCHCEAWRADIRTTLHKADALQDVKELVVVGRVNDISNGLQDIDGKEMQEIPIQLRVNLSG